MEVLISSFNCLCIVAVINFYIFYGSSNDYGPTMHYLFIYLLYHIISIFIFDIVMDYRL